MHESKYHHATISITIQTCSRKLTDGIRNIGPYWNRVICHQKKCSSIHTRLYLCCTAKEVYDWLPQHPMAGHCAHTMVWSWWTSLNTRWLFAFLKFGAACWWWRRVSIESDGDRAWNSLRVIAIFWISWKMCTALQTQCCLERRVHTARALKIGKIK